MSLWNFAKWQLLARVDGFPDFGMYRTLLRQERMTHAELADLRRAKTRRLVDTCLRHVPYYGDLLRAAGITAATVQGPEDLAVLPLLDKSIVRAQASRLLNRAASPQTYHPHTTGGSSGMPLDFYRGWEYAKLAASAATMRALHTLGWRPGDALIRFWAPASADQRPSSWVGRGRRAVRRWLQPPEMLFNAYATAPGDMEEWLGQLRAQRPRVFYGYASNIILFARFLTTRGERNDTVTGIATTGDALLPRDRALLHEVFPAATIIDIYGSREIPGIAAECVYGTMHINTDLVHVEYGLPITPGQYRLVVTALDNTVFPFIRYDIGDHGAPLEGACRCGRAFPAMRWGYGKVVDAFVSPEGRVMAGGFFEDLMHGVQGVHAFQFRQRAAADITLYVVPSSAFGEATRAYLSAVEHQIHVGFSPHVRVHVEPVPAIQPTRAGKYQSVVSDLPAR